MPTKKHDFSHIDTTLKQSFLPEHKLVITYDCGEQQRVLQHLFQLSVDSGLFHPIWKLSHIVPARKITSSIHPNNFRPVKGFKSLKRL